MADEVVHDEVVHDIEGSRYVLRRGEQELGEAGYDLREGVIRFLHTEIDPEVGEHGLGTILARGALDDVRATSDRRVVPLCPFIRHFIETHEDYRDLTTR